MNTKLFYGYYECITLDEVSEIVTSTNGKMAVVLTSTGNNVFTLSLYGTFDGDADSYGFDDADCEMFQGQDRFEQTKKLYETLKSNGVM